MTIIHHEDCDVRNATLAAEWQTPDEEQIDPSDYGCLSDCHEPRTLTITVTEPDEDGDWRVEIVDGLAADYSQELGDILPNAYEIRYAFEAGFGRVR